MAVKIKLTSSSPERTLKDAEFVDLVSRGTIGPTTLVLDPIYTDGEWRNADDIRFFHKLTGDRHPPGALLAARLSRERARREQDLALHSSLERHQDRFWFEEQLGPCPIETLLGPGVTGAARLTILPSFEPEEVVTLVWREGAVEIERAGSRSSLWAWLHRSTRDAATGEAPDQTERQRPFATAKVRSSRRALGGAGAPDWRSFRALAEDAADVSALALDGVSYRHSLAAPGEPTRAVAWKNPQPHQHPRACELVALYTALLERSGLRRRRAVQR